MTITETLMNDVYNKTKIFRKIDIIAFLYMYMHMHILRSYDEVGWHIIDLHLSMPQESMK